MNLDSSTSLDLAVLGLTIRGAQRMPALCQAVQMLLAPWVTPTVEVIEGRVARLSAAGELKITSDAVRATGTGRQTFASLMERGLPEHHHPLALAVEAVKLACLDLLEPAAQRGVAADLVAVRDRCRLRLSTRLAGSDEHPPAVARALRHQLALLETGRDMLQAYLVPNTARALMNA